MFSLSSVDMTPLLSVPPPLESHFAGWRSRTLAGDDRPGYILASLLYPASDPALFLIRTHGRVRRKPLYHLLPLLRLLDFFESRLAHPKILLQPVFLFTNTRIFHGLLVEYISLLL